MYEAAREAVTRARAGDGPSLIEGLTYRYEEHSLGMGRIRRGEYRSQDEIAHWQARDPIVIHTDRLVEQGIATAEECEEASAGERAAVDEALEFARNSPFPEPEELFDDMFADPIPQP